MFDRFGEMDSAEELNELAENMLNEGDTEGIKTLAAENGIGKEFVKMYLAGDIPVLCDAGTAAIGKLEAEERALKPDGIMKDWLDYTKALCMEDDAFARAVRRKGRDLKGCIAQLLAWSFKNAKTVDPEICKRAKVSGTVKLGIPDMGTAKKTIRKYYLGGGKDA